MQLVSHINSTSSLCCCREIIRLRQQRQQRMVRRKNNVYVNPTRTFNSISMILVSMVLLIYTRIQLFHITVSAFSTTTISNQQKQQHLRIIQQTSSSSSTRTTHSTLYQEKQQQQQQQESLSKQQQQQRFMYFADTIGIIPIKSNASKQQQQQSKVSLRKNNKKKLTNSSSSYYYTNTFMIRKMIRKNQRQCMKVLRDTTEACTTSISTTSIIEMTLQFILLLRSVFEMTIKAIITTIDRTLDIFITCCMNFWYLLPSILCVVPFYTLLAYQTMPVTPTIWKLVNIEILWCTQNAATIVTAFLASNTSFFIAAIYLLQQSGTIPSFNLTKYYNKRRIVQPVDKMNSLSQSTSLQSLSNDRRRSIPSALGYWVLSAGIMSTIFHTVQTLGNYRIAEALCYMDHGIAGTAICYFYYICGSPSIRTLVCGILGLITLAFPTTDSIVHLSIYTFLHSLWHTLAAITAVLWAYDSSKSSSSSVS